MYSSKEAAVPHNGCGCAAIGGFRDTKISGIDFDEMHQRWKKTARLDDVLKEPDLQDLMLESGFIGDDVKWAAINSITYEEMLSKESIKSVIKWMIDDSVEHPVDYIIAQSDWALLEHELPRYFDSRLSGHEFVLYPCGDYLYYVRVRERFSCDLMWKVTIDGGWR